MFKTKERDIDKANIRIAVLEGQLKELMEMRGESINERDAALGDARRLRKELHEYKELESELEKEVDRSHLLLKERMNSIGDLKVFMWDTWYKRGTGGLGLVIARTSEEARLLLQEKIAKTHPLPLYEIDIMDGPQHVFDIKDFVLTIGNVEDGNKGL